MGRSRSEPDRQTHLLSRIVLHTVPLRPNPSYPLASSASPRISSSSPCPTGHVSDPYPSRNVAAAFAVGRGRSCEVVDRPVRSFAPFPRPVSPLSRPRACLAARPPQSVSVAEQARRHRNVKYVQAITLPMQQQGPLQSHTKNLRKHQQGPIEWRSVRSAWAICGELVASARQGRGRKDLGRCFALLPHSERSRRWTKEHTIQDAFGPP